MHYDDKHAYLRLQKCGSSYIAAVLRAHKICQAWTGKYHDNPVTSEKVREVLADRRRIAFTFIRHPLDWLASIWRFRTGQGWGTQQELDDCRHESFNGFIDNYLRLHPGFVTELFEQFTGPADSPFVDFVGRLEFMPEDLPLAFLLMGVELQEDLLPDGKQNVSRTDPNLSRYLPHRRDLVMEAEQGAIERHNYWYWEHVA
jgi:hypothetical protein